MVYQCGGHSDYNLYFIEKLVRLVGVLAALWQLGTVARLVPRLLLPVRVDAGHGRARFQPGVGVGLSENGYRA